MMPNPILITPALVKSLLPGRSDLGSKSSFGSALVIAGSRHYTGAAFLAAAAALRGGTGLVYLAAPSSLHPALAGALPEAIWELLPEDAQGYLASQAAQLIPDLLKRRTAVLIGPGLGQAPGSRAVLQALLAAQPDIPTVIDADALRLLAQAPNWAKLLPPACVLTPHAGEMAALTQLSIAEVESQRICLAQQFARTNQATLVLKGPYTLIATAQGNVYQSDYASSALAHGGSGDVLAGLLTALLAQGASLASAAIAAVWLHAQAAQLALQRRGWEGAVLPSDLLEEIGPAVRIALDS